MLDGRTEHRGSPLMLRLFWQAAAVMFLTSLAGSKVTGSGLPAEVDIDMLLLRPRARSSARTWTAGSFNVRRLVCVPVRGDPAGPVRPSWEGYGDGVEHAGGSTSTWMYDRCPMSSLYERHLARSRMSLSAR